MKNYFIKDEALKSVDQDSFGHVDIANNIKNMIEYTDAPFNVAIIGKWGMGKSSLINMLKKVLEQDQTDVYMIQEINAWKYQKEEFGRAFLKQLLQGIEGRKFNSANYAQTECQFRYCGTAIPFLTVRSTAR